MLTTLHWYERSLMQRTFTGYILLPFPKKQVPATSIGNRDIGSRHMYLQARDGSGRRSRHRVVTVI